MKPMNLAFNFIEKNYKLNTVSLTSTQYFNPFGEVELLCFNSTFQGQ